MRKLITAVAMSAALLTGIATSASASTAVASCRTNARWNSYFKDWDVYVHSNLSDRFAKVTDLANGHHHGWWTNDRGYVDVYFRGASSGQRYRVNVGRAVCRNSF